MKKAIILKKLLLKEGLIALAVLSVIGGGFAYLWSIEASFNNELTRIKKQTLSLKSNAIGTRKEYDNVLEAYDVFQNIPLLKLPTKDGLNSYPLRVRAARPIITSLENRYRIIELKVTTLPPEKDTTVKGVTSTDIYNNKLTMSFKAATDELALSFVDSLIKELPGYALLDSITLSRINTISPAILEAIRENPKAVPLVKGEVSLIWRTLQEKPEENKGNATRG